MWLTSLESPPYIELFFADVLILKELKYIILIKKMNWKNALKLLKFI